MNFQIFQLLVLPLSASVMLLESYPPTYAGGSTEMTNLPGGNSTDGLDALRRQVESATIKRAERKKAVFIENTIERLPSLRNYNMTLWNSCSFGPKTA